MRFLPLERLMNLYDGYCRPFSVNGHSLLLVQDEGRCYLLRNQCPHQQAPLSNATIVSGNIRCPIHGITFSLLTGEAESGCSQKLSYVDIAYEGSQLGVVVDE